jgi:hypothetical protein
MAHEAQAALCGLRRGFDDIQIRILAVLIAGSTLLGTAIFAEHACLGAPSGLLLFGGHCQAAL